MLIETFNYLKVIECSGDVVSLLNQLVSERNLLLLLLLRHAGTHCYVVQ